MELPVGKKAKREWSRKGRGPRGMYGAPFYLIARFNLPGIPLTGLWKHIKAPPGWRKCPLFHYVQNRVQFVCTDPGAVANLTPEWVEAMKTKLILISESRR